MAQVRTRSFRESPYDTSLFVLQTAAAAARWPVDARTSAALRTALAECTPTAESLAAVESSERVHRGGGARAKGKRPRWGNAKRRASKRAKEEARR